MKSDANAECDLYQSTLLNLTSYLVHVYIPKQFKA